MTPFFADYSLLVILIEKEITEMNLDMDRVASYIFFQLYMIFYLGWDKMEFWSVFVPPL